MAHYRVLQTYASKFLREKGDGLNFSEIERVARIPKSTLSHVRAGRRELTPGQAWNVIVWLNDHYKTINTFLEECRDHL